MERPGTTGAARAAGGGRSGRPVWTAGSSRAGRVAGADRATGADRAAGAVRAQPRLSRELESGAGRSVPCASRSSSHHSRSYSLLWRAPEDEVIPLCRKNEISQIVWSPLAEGVLTGKYRPGSPPPAETRATSERMGATIGRRLDEATLERVERLRSIGERLGYTTAQVALAWILRDDNVAAPIVGASRPDQVRENAVAADIDLDPETIAEIEAVFA
ncbi:MAG TPA: aldo/keto reductase [Gaiellaceae bacterium]|nr:aldo/keto reductase [Gaiellaceae bacterium]